MSTADRAGGRRALVRIWNLAWDAGLLGAIVIAAWLVDSVAVHRGWWWIAAVSVAAFVSFDVGLRIGWWLMLRLLGRGR